MINKANDKDEPQDTTKVNSANTGYIDTAKLDVQCHLLIKDKDTGEQLVNKRG